MEDVEKYFTEKVQALYKRWRALPRHQLN